MLYTIVEDTLYRQSLMTIPKKKNLIKKTEGQECCAGRNKLHPNISLESWIKDYTLIPDQKGYIFRWMSINTTESKIVGLKMKEKWN